MTYEMRVLLDALEAEKQDWLQISTPGTGDTPFSARICGAVLGGLHQRLTEMLRKPRPCPDGWQDVSDLRGGISE